MNNTLPSRFAGFGHDATELSAYIYSADTFIISLHNQNIIRFVTEEAAAFQQWLQHHGIRNVNDTLGKMVYDYYFPAKN